MNLKLTEKFCINHEGILTNNYFQAISNHSKVIDVDENEYIFVDENNNLINNYNEIIGTNYLKTRIKLDGTYKYKDIEILGNFIDYNLYRGKLFLLTNDNEIQIYDKEFKLFEIVEDKFKKLGKNCAINFDGKIYYLSKDNTLEIKDVNAIKSDFLTIKGKNTLVYLTNNNELFINDDLIYSNCLSFSLSEYLLIYIKEDGYLGYVTFFENLYFSLNLSVKYLSIFISGFLFMGVLENGSSHTIADIKRDYTKEELFYFINEKIMRKVLNSMNRNFSETAINSKRRIKEDLLILYQDEQFLSTYYKIVENIKLKSKLSIREILDEFLEYEEYKNINYKPRNMEDSSNYERRISNLYSNKILLEIV